MTARVRAAVAVRPSHALLTALVVGLAAGPRVGAAAVAGLAALAACVAPRAVLALGLAVAVALGAGWATARTSQLQTSHLPRFVDAEATVLQQPRAGPFGAAVLAEVHGEHVLLRLPAAVTPDVGAIVHVAGTARPPGGYARHLGARAEIRVHTAWPTGRQRRSLVDPVRRTARAALGHGLPAQERALAQGMVLGDDSGLSDVTKDEFRATGLTHLVAASGANVALLVALVFAAARLIGVGLTARATAAVAVIALYVPLAGGGPSIQRAGVMGAAAALALIAGRPASRGHALLLAATITLAHDPRALTDPGWQLSFAAVAALLLRARNWTQRLKDRKVPPVLAESIAVSALAGLATAPLLAAHFGQVSLVGLPANVLAAPLVAPVMWLGTLAIVAQPLVPSLAGLLTAVAAYPLAALLALAHAAAAVPGAQTSLRPAPVLAICALVVLVVERRPLTARLPPSLRRPATRALIATVTATVALGAVGYADRRRPPPPPQSLRVTFLDVGQGDATLVQDRTHAILFDTGPPEGDVVTRLRRAGVTRLDLLVVTHAETDHAGGAADVLRHVPVATLLDGSDGVLTPAARALHQAASRTRTLTPDAGQTLRVGTLTVRVVSPRAEPPGSHPGADPNERAIVAEVDQGTTRVLLTADAESPITLPLHLQGPFDVLKVAHHGSADDGLPALLTAWQPRIAVMSVGAHNRFGHPTPGTVRALLGTRAAVYRTDRDGTVRLDRTRKGWEVRTHG